MERKTVQLDQEKVERLSMIAKNKGGLCRAIWEYSQQQYGVENQDALWEELTKIYGKAPELLETEAEFWNPELERALAALEGESFVADMKQIVHMQMKGHFSGSTWRRSYRSKNFRYYVTRIISDLKSCLLLTLQKQNVAEMLYCHYEWIIGYYVSLALELYRNNERCVNPVKEAILGENSEVLLSGPIIWAIVISGNEELLDLLLKLLAAARLQEGLRQIILECADAGSVETQIRILKVCLDEDMFRFSSVIRAFNTWTGLGYMDVKAPVVKKYAALAYEYLTNQGSREHAVNSENNLEAYLALWATGCYEIQDTNRKVEELLRDESKYRRILGWYFVSHTDNSLYRMRKAMEHLDERDEELLAWVVRNLSATRLVLGNWTIRDTESSVTPAPNSDFPSDQKEREELFRKLKGIALFIGNKKKEFKGKPFPFSCIALSVEQVISCLMSVAGYDMNLQMIDELMGLFPYMTAEQRQAVYGNFLAPDKEESHRQYYLDALRDKSITVRQLIVRRLSECTLQERDILVLCESLRTRNSDMRKSVISVLVKQTPELQRKAVQNLLEADEENRIQAGIEMMLELREEYPEIMKIGQERVGVLLKKSLSTQTEILLKRLAASENDSEQTYTKENGFGLYDPAVAAERLKTFQEEEFAADTLWTEEQLREWIPSDEDYMKILERMNQVFVRHADYEYEIEMHDGSHRKVLLGDGYSLIPAEYGCESRLSEGVKLTMIPFWEEFVEAAGEYVGDVKKILGIMYVAAGYDFRPYDPYYEVQDWYKPIESKNLEVTYSHWDKYKTLYWHMVDVIQLFLQQSDPHEVFETAFAIYQSMIAIVGEENLGKNMIQMKEDRKERYFHVSEVSAYPINLRMIGYWRVLIGNMSLNAEDFRRWFLAEYRLEHISGVSVYGGLFLDDYFRACDEKVIALDTLYDWLLFGNKQEFGWYDRFARMNRQNHDHICILTNPVRYKAGRDIYERYPWAKDTVNRMVLRIVEVESRRGELSTDVTELATQIVYFEGAKYFCSLLAALGKDNFFRGYYYSDNTKRAVLSQLLKRCYPSKEDTPEKLAALLKKTDIKEKRLAEAVMYAPQWAEFAEKLMGWQGLKKAVWFFHAHINEHFSAEKETEVAIYSPVSPQQFNDGVFDKDWFLDVYETLGEKRFQVLYKSAKYITSGNSQHRRSQLYADAAMGKLDAAEFAAEIMDKRNQEKLRAYAVIPVPGDKPEELLQRYEFIQRFLKESRQFGAQRRESEKKACQVALENLSITSGFRDVNRMTWYLESKKIDEIRPLMEPVEIGGVSIYLDISADGIAELAIRKAGKVQKTLPAALKKNETVLRIKEIVKELKEQRSRARKSLEAAMVERTAFGIQELINIVKNPVISPMLFSLVWTNGKENGFLKPAEEENTVGQGKKIEDNVNCEVKLVLKNLRGQSRVLNEEETLWIAHPYDLKKAGEWADYMHVLYEQKLVQPFKQVFREFYPITEDEMQEKTISRRYAGYQVQPQRTAALLKDRGWTVDYAEGMQRVCYQENLIVRMYALADWFSPADIEAPTLEVIRFHDRSTGKSVELEKVPPVLFSEVMRDIDLVVSVAHVGGVDPETSHSTVEMRTAIARELVQLLRLPQVEFIGSHAKIHGKLADYSIHMGSGVVHAEGKGMLSILPVHSQARGRIFLPFVDDDPKTAEIMSKIILLAEDNKIKDPTILQQLS